MNFTGLSYFLAVAEDGNITRTAEKLHITQQALSAHMSKLEKELGVVLFERTPAFTLTYAGERLRTLADSMMDLEKQIFRESADIADGERCRLSIGVSYTCGRAILPAVLPGFCREHPLVEINLMEGNSSELETWMAHGLIDFMIAFEPIKLMGVETFTLREESLYLVLPQDMTRAAFGEKFDSLFEENSRKADISLFAGVPFIKLKHGNRARDMLDEYLEHTGFEPNVILETENSETALALAQAGMGATVFSELFLNYIHPGMIGDKNCGVDFFPLASEKTRSELVIARMAHQYHSRMAEAFLKHCVSSLSADTN